LKLPKANTPEWVGLKRKLLTVSQFGAFLLTAFGGFYSNIAPPDDDLRFWPSYASLVAGLAFVACKGLSKTTRRLIMGFAIAFAALFPVYYFAEYQQLTAKYVTSKVICGTQYTTRGAEYVAKYPDISKEDLVFAFGGKVKDIWTENSINRARLVLGLIYSGGFAFLALALLTGLQESK
jgi:hypothetical protein